MPEDAVRTPRKGLRSRALERAVLAPAVAFSLALPGAGGCICPASPKEVADASQRTPAATVRSFQAYLASDLRDLEYRSFSSGFTGRNGLSLLSYSVGRDELFARRPYLKYFAKARIVAEGSEGEGCHWVDAKVGGRTVRVKLVREDFFEIRAGAELLADGLGEWDRWVRAAPAHEGSRIEAAVALEIPVSEAAAASEVRFGRAWKIDDFQEPPRAVSGKGASP